MSKFWLLIIFAFVFISLFIYIRNLIITFKRMDQITKYIELHSSFLKSWESGNDKKTKLLYNQLIHHNVFIEHLIFPHCALNHKDDNIFETVQDTYINLIDELNFEEIKLKRTKNPLSAMQETFLLPSTFLSFIFKTSIKPTFQNIISFISWALSLYGYKFIDIIKLFS